MSHHMLNKVAAYAKGHTDIWPYCSYHSRTNHNVKSTATPAPKACLSPLHNFKRLELGLRIRGGGEEAGAIEAVRFFYVTS